MPNKAQPSFLDSLLARGDSLYLVKLMPEVEEPLVNHVIEDVQDGFSQMQVYRENMIEMNENWRGSTTEKDFPFEDCANIRVPFTSVIIQQMQARFMKAIFGGEHIAEFSALDKVFKKDDIDDFNAWFDWELRQTVKLKPAMRDIIHDVLLYGNAFPIPYYERKTQELRSYKRFGVPQEGNIEQYVQQQADAIIGEYPGVSISASPDYGVYQLADIQGKAAGLLTFCAREHNGIPEIVCEIRRREIVFDGVEVFTPNIEEIGRAHV